MIDEPNCTVTERSSHLPHGYFKYTRRFASPLSAFIIGAVLGLIAGLLFLLLGRG